MFDKSKLRRKYLIRSQIVLALLLGLFIWIFPVGQDFKPTQEVKRFTWSGVQAVSSGKLTWERVLKVYGGLVFALVLGAFRISSETLESNQKRLAMIAPGLKKLEQNKSMDLAQELIAPLKNELTPRERKLVLNWLVFLEMEACLERPWAKFLKES